MVVVFQAQQVHSHQVGAALASVAAGFARDRTGTYTAAWFSAALLCVVAAVISVRVRAHDASVTASRSTPA